jgi:hypothetical protein
LSEDFLDSLGTAAAGSEIEIKPSVSNIMAVNCLSLNQPYADLLISGKKTIEVRRWSTNFRGQFLVHASRSINQEACNRLKIEQAKLVTGAIVGKANLYNVISYGSKNAFLKDKNKHFASSNYSNPKYGFLVNEAKRFDIPIPIRGKLGFFNVDLSSFNLEARIIELTK